MAIRVAPPSPRKKPPIASSSPASHTWPITNGGTASGIGALQLAVEAVARDPKDLEAALASKKSANEIRRLYDVELGRLFHGEPTMDVVKHRELLRRLDVVGLRLNEAADRLSDAAIKRWA